MREAREQQAWDHTATIISWLVEPHRDRKLRREPFTMFDFHPYRTAPPKPAPLVSAGAKLLASLPANAKVTIVRLPRKKAD